ncbi:RAN GTPase-activating protein 2-like [Actinidia eriantha]|uniref:RAN GTPase-activating protein 2-like n=1 Tax=Actinidia eriantha TaxID=165200 RepID=UPI002589EA57|nr:RAN GTPase-activating protein 2-like [Actinidia eriantha]
MDAPKPNFQRQSFSIKLWPPSQNTRLILVERITNHLSSQSVVTQKYGSLNKEEAAENAKGIDDAAFASANQHYEMEPDGDGSSAMQLYAKECSKLILEVLKKGPRTKANGEVVKVERVVGPHETLFDISKGHQAFIVAEEAQELLRPVKEPGNSYTKICFSNRSFDLDAANIAGPILESVKDRLREVDLSNFIAGRPKDEALEVMNVLSEALGEKVVRAFGKLLKSQHNLRELYLMNDGISEEVAKAGCELIPSTEKLKILQFHNDMTRDEGAVAISKIVKHSPLLEDFRCSSTRVDFEGGVALSETLGTSTHLKKLDLRDSMFGVEVLSKVILNHTNLTEVYLTYQNLEDDGAIAIVNALKDSAPSLEILDMAGNDITAKAAPCLAACITEKQLLTKLNLSENELKDVGAIQISKGLQINHDLLKEVDMSTNKIRRAGARVLAQAVEGKPEFKLLNIDGNFISDEGIDELKRIFKASPDLLGSLDENDPDGVDDDNDDDEKQSGYEDEGDMDGLESKLKNLGIN